MAKLMILMLVTLLISGCTLPAETIQKSCCAECLNAFSQSPVGVGPQAARCGGFTSAVPLSEQCRDYYQTNPWTVQQCQKLESENGR